MINCKKIYFSCYRGSPLGDLFVASIGEGICDLSFSVKKKNFLERLAAKYGNPVEESSSRFSRVFRLLTIYFKGIPVRFDVPLDAMGTDFERLVWEAIKMVPFGTVVSYGRVAEMVGRPSGARAVGNACGKNPVPIIIPCHRVITSSGRLGGYTGGVKIKRALLNIEGVRI